MSIQIEEPTITDTKEPYKIALLDVDKYIKENNIGEVTSQFIRVPSSNELDPNGLFSQTIFGEIGSPERMLNFGYINLRTKIFHPKIYKTLLSLKKLYGEIMSSNTFAYFDEEVGDLIKIDREDERARTGYSFFMEYVQKIKFKASKSLQRSYKVKLIDNHIESMHIDKYLIMMAGIRDINMGDIDNYDDANKLYMSLIALSQALPSGSYKVNPVYDTVRYAIQRKANEIFDYYTNFMSDKHGWAQDKFQKRSIVHGARNVISAATIAGDSPTDPRMLKSHECIMGTLQSINVTQPIAIYYLKRMFFNQVVQETSTQIPVIDPKSLSLHYTEISPKMRDRFVSSDGISTTIKRFEDASFRASNVTLEDLDGKTWNIYNVYDDGEQVIIFRDINELSTYREGDIDKSYIRPLTYIEMFYIVAFHATKGKHGLCTRYQVTNDDNTITPRIRVATTKPDRLVRLTTMFDPDVFITLPHYPIIGNGYVDSMIVHPGTLSTFDADYDGDALNGSAILTTEANKNIEDFLFSLNGVITPDRKLRFEHNGFTKANLYALTRPFLPTEIEALQ